MFRSLFSKGFRLVRNRKSIRAPGAGWVIILFISRSALQMDLILTALY